jgi:RHS repeat-associated protein
MLVPNKHGTSRDYRYGFNGKEMDNEIKGEGNSIDYEARFFDPRVGRFLSLDPLGKKFPWYTPYQFAGNTPIWAVDLDGKEEYIYQLTLSKNNKGKPVLFVSLAQEINYSLIPDAIEPDHFKLRDLDGRILEFNFDTKKELFKNILGKNIQQIRNASAKELEKTERKAIEGIAAIEMFQVIGHIEEGALKHDFGSDDEIFDENTAEWQGPLNYENLKEPRKVGPFLETTKAQRNRILEYNKKMNGGVLMSDEDGTVADMPTTVAKGAKANMNQAEIDHVDERVNGGSNSNKNLRVITKSQNLKKEAERRKK